MAVGTADVDVSGRPSTVFPEIEPYDTGMLDVGDGNLVYWEACGNPDGKPVVVLHGGPGSGCTPMHRRWFDPAKYRIVLFDQRNAGRSAPHASDPATDLTANTTQHLIADIERLRVHLGIERWLVWGNSWGSTLALVYAETFPERVSEVVLLAVTNTSRRSIDWLYHGIGQFFPAAWERFRHGVPEDQRDGDLVAAYYQLMQNPDLTVRELAASRWCEWEDAVVKLSPDDPPNPRYDDPRFRMAFTRIVTHYFHHAAWLDDGMLLRDAGRLAGIPGALIHGFLDLGGPVYVAWELASAWPDAELIVCGRAGHFGPEMTEAGLRAIDRFADH